MYKVEWLKYQQRVKKKEEDDREKERGMDIKYFIHVAVDLENLHFARLPVFKRPVDGLGKFLDFPALFKFCDI